MFKHCKAYFYGKVTHSLAVFLTLLALTHYSFKASGLSHSAGNIALLGDSMTWIGGDSCQKPNGWSHVLKKSGIADTICVFARSGATWTNTNATKPDISFYSEILHDNNVVYNQALRLIEIVKKNKELTPDCIIIFAGANDAWFSLRRPGIFNSQHTPEDFKFSEETDVSEITSLSESVMLVCDMLQSYFPLSSYVIVTPLQMAKVSAEEIFQVSDIIEMSALSRGCTVLRADKNVEICHDIEKTTPTFTYDGVHTNAEGARLVGEYILMHLPLKRQITEN